MECLGTCQFVESGVVSPSARRSLSASFTTEASTMSLLDAVIASTNTGFAGHPINGLNRNLITA